MDTSAKVYIAGHNGLVGSAVVRKLQKEGYTNLLLRYAQELDLTDQATVQEFFSTERPKYVVDCAAKVGGIKSEHDLPDGILV